MRPRFPRLSRRSPDRDWTGGASSGPAAEAKTAAASAVEPDTIVDLHINSHTWHLCASCGKCESMILFPGISSVCAKCMKKSGKPIAATRAASEVKTKKLLIALKAQSAEAQTDSDSDDQPSGAPAFKKRKLEFSSSKVATSSDDFRNCRMCMYPNDAEYQVEWTFRTGSLVIFENRLMPLCAGHFKYVCAMADCAGYKPA